VQYRTPRQISRKAGNNAIYYVKNEINKRNRNGKSYTTKLW
jgi:hypothetical protein